MEKPYTFELAEVKKPIFGKQQWNINYEEIPLWWMQAAKSEITIIVHLLNRAHHAGRLTAPRSPDLEIWISGDGRKASVDKLDRTHLNNILNLILRKAREGKAWLMGEDGVLRHR